MSGENRLPSPAGLLIDRDRPVSFRFDGRGYDGYAGDTIASALAANGRWLISRSFKYHRPRAVLSMAGQDGNSLVQLPHEPNVRADREAVRDGLEVRAQNFVGSLERDRGAIMGLFGRFLPVGFYYKTFYRPRGAWKYWEPVIRRMAGLGRVSLDAPHGYFDKAYAHCDVAVVGGGPAGMSAALAAAEAGAEVWLIDENPVLGGSLAYARFDAAGEQAEPLRRRLLTAVKKEPRIRVMTDAVCNGWFADNFLPVIRGNRLYKLRARQVVVAAGMLEQQAVFRNNDIPGVMLGSAAQRLIRLYGVRPGRRAVVLAGNDDGYGVALDLADAGVEVAAVVDLRDGPGDGPLAAAAIARGLDIRPGHTVYEAVPRHGNRHVRGAFVSRIVGQGTVDGGGRVIDCDLVAMSTGYVPAYQLPCQSGARLGYDDAKAMFSLDGLPGIVRLAGSVDGRYELDAVLADGRHVGAAAAIASGFGRGKPPSRPRQSGTVNHPWPIFPHPRGHEFVDFDEDLQIKDIEGAISQGYADVQLIKRFSTVGMGPSQGRHSALATARLAARATGRSVAETGVTTARPPVTPEKLGVLAGRSFEPIRHTPMHHRHLEAGATMMPAGQWLRPSHYGPAEAQSSCREKEALNVRGNVGLIDVSTLGGIEIRGPDAPEFLNRMYTFAFLRQPVGRSRYLLMTNEAGVVIDDGVACRLAEDHYYVTATTGGADNVYRQMLWWNAQWRLEVDVANVTAAWCGVNIAGPRSREVMHKVCDDIDLSPEGFPYIEVRTGHVAGIPARVLRVGFVGELGYEVHAPAGQGEALWDALIEAGTDFEIVPFGVEAQRLLRLEKGHIIIGQDTDSMSHPEEIDMGWAIARKKPFFVGSRSIQAITARPPIRRLVGFSIDDPAAPVPKEAHLTLAGEVITGRVTSCYASPTLGRTIGLAYVAPEQAEEGTRFDIKAGGGEIVQATVVRPPFYDPDNSRQEM